MIKLSKNNRPGKSKTERNRINRAELTKWRITYRNYSNARPLPATTFSKFIFKKTPTGQTKHQWIKHRWNHTQTQTKWSGCRNSRYSPKRFITQRRTTFLWRIYRIRFLQRKIIEEKIPPCTRHWCQQALALAGRSLPAIPDHQSLWTHRKSYRRWSGICRCLFVTRECQPEKKGL